MPAERQGVSLSTTEGYVWRPCPVPGVHRAPTCAGGQLEALAGDPGSPLNRGLAAILSRPLACDACLGVLLARGRE